MPCSFIDRNWRAIEWISIELGDTSVQWNRNEETTCMHRLMLYALFVWLFCVALLDRQGDSVRAEYSSPANPLSRLDARRSGRVTVVDGRRAGADDGDDRFGWTRTSFFSEQGRWRATMSRRGLRRRTPRLYAFCVFFPPSTPAGFHCTISARYLLRFGFPSQFTLQSQNLTPVQTSVPN